MDPPEGKKKKTTMKAHGLPAGIEKEDTAASVAHVTASALGLRTPSFFLGTHLRFSMFIRIIGSP